MSEIRLTRQHQITIPKRVCEELHLEGGDSFEVIVTPDHKLLLQPKKLIDADDPAYRLGRAILEAERQIKRGQVVSWSDVKKRHRL